MKRVFLLFFVLFFLIFHAACSNSKHVFQGEKIIVTTTIAQIADIVKNVGGEHVVVESLMGPGIDPHLYKASQGDIVKLEKADVIFYNGLFLEGKMIETLEKINEKKPAYAVAEAVPKELLLTDEKDKNAVDPHIWFDPNLWKYAVETVRDALIGIDKENEEHYLNNAHKYIELLDELDAYAKREIEKIPKESRILITAHDAFGYFGRAYGFEVIGLQGLSTDSEYGLKDVQHLIDIIVERNIQAIFLETSIPDRSINAVIEGAKEKGHDVKIGGELYSDAMGEENTLEGTYKGMFKHNIDTIVSSLK
mgnify:CR=1 FL=1